MIFDNTTKPIIHIATDEKFIDGAYDIYEKALPGKNLFLILFKKDQKEIKYLSTDKAYEFIDTSGNYLSNIKEKIDKARVLVFHEMNSEQAHIATSISKKGKSLIWNAFGYEIYSNPYLFDEELVGDKTYDRFVSGFKNKIKNLLRPYYYRYLRGRKDPYKNRIKAVKRMDYIGILYEEEFELYHKLVGLDEEIKQLKFSYYPMNVIISKEQKRVSDQNILLGNSASYTNNHLEAFDFLNRINLSTRKIITPLSYGNKEYATKIIEEGKKALGTKFEPLTEFLPLREYQKILQKCDIVIMNHYRKQAGGNILSTLFMGAKVYLSRRNILFHYFKRIGCHVYCIEDDLKPNNPDALKRLDSKKMQCNRDILKKELSLERICTELQATINPLLNSYKCL